MKRVNSIKESLTGLFPGRKNPEIILCISILLIMSIMSEILYYFARWIVSCRFLRLFFWQYFQDYSIMSSYIIEMASDQCESAAMRRDIIRSDARWIIIHHRRSYAPDATRLWINIHPAWIITHIEAEPFSPEKSWLPLCGLFILNERKWPSVMQTMSRRIKKNSPNHTWHTLMDSGQPAPSPRLSAA